jgi:Flp pilus assembly protein TadD
MKSNLKKEIEALPDEIRWRLVRADGFLDLRMAARAAQELAAIAAPFDTLSPVLEVRMRLAFEEQRWADATQLARELVQRLPGSPDYAVQLAYATRRSEGLPPATFILEEARKRFPHVAVIPFNLACYACQSGRSEEAMALLKQAVTLEPRYREAALEDEDLKPLWPLLEE